MRTSRLLITAVAAFLAGCSDTTAPPASTVVSVTVTPSSGTLDAVGASVQFTAQAKDGSGTPVSGRSVTWASSNTAIATLSTTGLATAVSPGTAAITATVDGVAGSAVLTVSEASQACNNAKTVTLTVGGAQTYEGSDCIVLPAGLSGDRYRVAVVRPATTGSESDVITATLKVVGLGVAQAPEPVGAVSVVWGEVQGPSGFPGAAAQEALRVASATERFHERLHLQEQAEAIALIKRAGGRRVVEDLSHLPALSAGPAQAAPVKRQFDVSLGGCALQAGSARTGVLVYDATDLAIYQDSTQNATNAAPQNLLTTFGAYYGSFGKPAVEDYFGKIPDIDGDGRLTVFITPVAAGDTAAYVSYLDAFTKTSCPSSNEADLVYFNLSHLNDIADGQYQALGTLAHEAKHVVSSYNRAVAGTRTGTDQYHPLWIEEGTAEIADEMASRYAWATQGGPAVGATANRQSFLDTPGNFTAENYGVLIHNFRTAGYLSSQPNGLVVVPTGAGEIADLYGSGWLFHRWMGDVYGKSASAPKADAAFFRALNDSLAAKGVAGIESQTGGAFLDLFRDFVISNSLHRTGAPEGNLAYTSYDFPEVGAFFCGIGNPVGDFPWPITTTGTPRDCDNQVAEVSNPSATFGTATHAGPIGISGMRIHDFLSNGTGTGAQITLNTGGKAAKIQVIRIR